MLKGNRLRADPKLPKDLSLNHLWCPSKTGYTYKTRDKNDGYQGVWEYFNLGEPGLMTAAVPLAAVAFPFFWAKEQGPHVAIAEVSYRKGKYGNGKNGLEHGFYFRI